MAFCQREGCQGGADAVNDDSRSLDRRLEYHRYPERNGDGEQGLDSHELLQNGKH